MCYSRITLKSIQCDWDEFFVASVITASKENLYQSHIAITYRFYFELTINAATLESAVRILHIALFFVVLNDS